ncbi:restriction endonuclease subunit S [Pseudomonas protegens]|uniref:restriction endonuclease subunit S n=1 Tax=Pseudomonas protegens TaxID=380021 RepID=UPI001B32F845|nr:restriction endonuclease subunit S [Pseudomonas protegens]MBP5123271.1 restriction endonuclease subunit S [Pseudomonas protegens]
MNELPKGWKVAALGDICTQPVQRTPSDDESFIYIDIASVDRTLKVVSKPQQLLGAEAPSRARKVVNTGDVIVSMTRPNLNAVALIHEQHNNCIASTGFDVLKPNEIDSRWIFAAVRSAQFVEAMCEKVQGALYPAVNSADIRKHKIGVPPRAEQTRIAQKLDELLAQVDTLKARVDAIPALLKRFRQSVLAAAVSGRLTEEWRTENTNLNKASTELLIEIEQERKLAFQADAERVGKNKKYKNPVTIAIEGLPKIPNSWAWVSVDSLASKVVDGVHKKPDYKSAGIPFITVKNLTATNGISFTDTKFVSPEDHEEFYKRANPENGDLLISKDGTLGVIRQVKTNAEFSIFVSVALVKPALRSTSDYLEIAFKSPQVQAQMVGVGSGLQHIHLTDLKQDAIPLPPKEEQTEIVRRVEQLFAFADQLEAKVASAKSRIDLLTQSILAKAFRGELVPQDPNDEPASVLLERIKAQRAAAPKAKRGRKAATSDDSC